MRRVRGWVWSIISFPRPGRPSTAYISDRPVPPVPPLYSQDGEDPLPDDLAVLPHVEECLDVRLG